MPSPTDVHGLNRPNGNETFTRAAFNAILDQIDGLRDVKPMTTAQRNALTAAQKWTDRIIKLSDGTLEWQRWTGAAWTTDLFPALATDAELAAHEADTTSIHGITDTANIALKNASNTYTGEQIFSRAIRVPITSVNANTTLDNTHETVLVDASGGARTMTLPAAAGCTGRRYNVKKVDSSANGVIIDPNGAETIDGATTKTIAVQYDSLTIESDGAGWVIV